ncbi:MAG: hypothetical protein ABIJ34_02900 [archaeon]
MKKKIEEPHLTVEEIEEELSEDSKFVRFLKRTYILIIAVFMILLLLVNTNAGYHIISVASGKIVSSSFDEYTFELKNGNHVIFAPSAWDELSVMYEKNQKHEFKACLLGYKKDDSYFIEGIYIPVIYSQDVYSVTSQMCNNETIISLHSHPPLRCIFSEQDILSYNQFRAVSKDGMIGLMCEEKRLSFYGYNQ